MSEQLRVAVWEVSFSNADVAGGLLWVTSPAWAAMITGGLAAKLLSGVHWVSSVYLGLGVGVLAIAITVMVTIFAVLYGLPFVSDSWFYIPTPASMAVTAALCWRMHHQKQQKF